MLPQVVLVCREEEVRRVCRYGVILVVLANLLAYPTEVVGEEVALNIVPIDVCRRPDKGLLRGPILVETNLLERLKVGYPRLVERLDRTVLLAKPLLRKFDSARRS